MCSRLGYKQPEISSNMEVVEKETEYSWTWFLGLLQKDLQVSIGGRGWVIVSDQQKGLLNAVAMLFPDIEHIMRHIF